MREILFRGKHRDEGFVYGYVGVFKGITQIYVPFTEEEEKANHSVLRSAIGGLWYEVDHSTVGQYTGLCDKNGKKIFEGDILSGYFSAGVCVNGLVEFKDGSFGILWKWGDGRQFAAFTSITRSVEFEIIGNCHDNPELLEVSHE